MARCRKIRRTKTQLCVGDKSCLVTLWDRDIKAPDTTTTAATERYSDPCAIWASISTPRPVELFADNNTLLGTVTHKIGIEYIPRVLSVARTRIEFEGQYYRLLRQEDPEERHLELILSCELIGSKEAAINA